MKKDIEFSASEEFWAVANTPALPIFANLAWIRHKHPEEFKSNADVWKHIDFVINGKSFYTLPASTKSALIFLRQGSRKCAVIQLVAIRDSKGIKGYRVLTAYTTKPALILRAIEFSGGPVANLEAGGRGKAAHPGPQGQSCEEASHRTTKNNPKRKTRNNPSLAPQESSEIAMPKKSPKKSLETVWKAWTGSEPGQSFSLNLDNPKDCPIEVVMLGRLSKLITAKGKVEIFADGPFLVTDGKMKKVWLVDHEPRNINLDLKGGLIGYYAKKIKNGDKGPVEYIHAFTGRAKAVMEGEVGRLSGQFRLTEAGIEG